MNEPEPVGNPEAGRARSQARPRRGAPIHVASSLAGAVDGFLDALGLPPDVRRSAELAGTPSRVAEAWRQELLDGYATDPAQVLAEASPTRSRELVAVTGIEYHSVCPHHLLPSRGVAHVGYLPGGRLVGFGQLVRLVDALAHRLVLQEELAAQIAGALVAHLGARGAGCVLEAEHLCLTVRGERRARARAHAEGWAGTLARGEVERRGFRAAIEQGAAVPPLDSGRRAATTAPGERVRRRARSRSEK